jgi:hypothetical protein
MLWDCKERILLLFLNCVKRDVNSNSASMEDSYSGQISLAICLGGAE